MNNSLLNDAQLKLWIKRRLGDPMLKIPLSDDQLGDAVDEAKRWFAARKGVYREVAMATYSGQPEYALPDDCDRVVDVAFQVAANDLSLIFAPQIVGDEKVPYNVFAAPSSAGLYSSFVQALQYVDMAKRVLGAEFNWFQRSKTENKTANESIMLLPPPSGVGSVIITYKSYVGNIEQLGERDHDLVKRFALAWAKRDLGTIFSRYPTLPGASGQVSLNGKELLTQAEKEIEELHKEIFESGKGVPFVVG